MNPSPSMQCPEPTLFPLAVKGQLDESLSVEIFAHVDTCEHCREGLRKYEMSIFDDAAGDLDTKSVDTLAVDSLGMDSLGIDSLGIDSLDVETAKLAGLLTSLGRVPNNQGTNNQETNSHEKSADCDIEADSDEWAFRDEVKSFRSDRYRLLSLLGSGAMGVVYLAQDNLLHRNVALKMPSRRNRGHDAAKSVARFRREARAAAKLRHPNICPVYDVGSTGTRQFIAMAYIDGVTLDRFITQHPIDSRGAAEMVCKIARAIAEAHRVGVIHRDLKPGNIMIDARGEPLVTDFGLAFQDDEQTLLTQTGATLGTPAYMAPEQIESDPSTIDARADIYSLGVILYELLAGRRPYQAKTIVALLSKVAAGQAKPAAEWKPNLDRDLDRICWKMIHTRRELRYASMDQVADELERYLTGRPLTQTSDRRLPSKRQFRIALGMTALIAGAWLTIVTIQTDRGRVTININDGSDATVNVDVRKPVPIPLANGSVWSPRVNLGPPVNGAGWDEHPEFSADGLTLYYSCGGRIFYGKRDSIDSRFTSRFELKELDAPDGIFDSDPTLTADELEVIFTSFRGEGDDGDLWTARRPSVDQPFETPVPLPGPVNTGMFEFHAKFAPDGLTLYFVSDRDGAMGQVDLWQATRANRSEPFGNVTSLGPAINSVANDQAVEVSADGKWILFASDRRGSTFEIFQSRRDSRDAPWSPAEALGGVFDGPGIDTAPAISPDGKTIVFTSSNPEGLGALDLYQSTRIKD